MFCTKKFYNKIRNFGPKDIFGYEEWADNCGWYAKAISRSKRTQCYVINAKEFHKLFSDKEKQGIFLEPRTRSNELRKRSHRETTKNSKMNRSVNTRESPASGLFFDSKTDRK